jgi:hypothetical protein
VRLFYWRYWALLCAVLLAKLAPIAWLNPDSALDLTHCRDVRNASLEAPGDRLALPGLSGRVVYQCVAWLIDCQPQARALVLYMSLKRKLAGPIPNQPPQLFKRPISHGG